MDGDECDVATGCGQDAVTGEGTTDVVADNGLDVATGRGAVTDEGWDMAAND